VSQGPWWSYTGLVARKASRAVHGDERVGYAGTAGAKSRCFSTAGGTRFLLGDPSVSLATDERLDVSRLQDLVLAPHLGIGDVRTDKRIEFVGGARGTSELEQIVTTEPRRSRFHFTGQHRRFDADIGRRGIMPPKSTWFEPKLRDGLLSHPI
jgi:uncharacterized protein (DUF1015 family)